MPEVPELVELAEVALVALPESEAVVHLYRPLMEMFAASSSKALQVRSSLDLTMKDPRTSFKAGKEMLCVHCQ